MKPGFRLQNIIFAVLVLSIAVVMPNAAWASAWLVSPGEWDILTSGRSQETPYRRTLELNPYIETGLRNDWGLGANLTSRQTTARDGGAESASAVFGELFVKKPIYRGDFDILSLQLAAGTSGDTLGAQTRGLDELHPTAELRAMYGVSSDTYDWGSVFLNSEVAARSFFGKKGNEGRGEETLGWKTASDNLFLGQLFWTKNWNAELGAGDYDGLTGQVSYVHRWNDTWRTQAGVSTALGGRRVDFEPVYLISVWYRWK